MRKLLCLMGLHVWFSDPNKWIDSFMKCEPGMQQCRHCGAQREAPISEIIHID